MAHQTHTPGRFFVIGIFMIFAIIMADQYSKWFVLETMLRDSEVALTPFKTWFFTTHEISVFEDVRENYNAVTLTSFMDFVMVWNHGISFGMLQNGGQLMTLGLTFIGLIVSLSLLIYMVLTNKMLINISSGLIAGGALGNTIDRIRFGAVADFIDIHVNGMHWPAFNVADAAIAIGAVIFIISTLNDDKAPHR